jgi:hypothetical protein
MNKENRIEANQTSWANLKGEEITKKVNQVLKGYSIEEKLRARDHLLILAESSKVEQDDLDYLTAMEGIHFSKSYLGEDKKKIITLAIQGTHLETVAEFEILIRKLRNLVVGVAVSSVIKSKTQI